MAERTANFPCYGAFGGGAIPPYHIRERHAHAMPWADGRAFPGAHPAPYAHTFPDALFLACLPACRARTPRLPTTRSAYHPRRAKSGARAAIPSLPCAARRHFPGTRIAPTSSGLHIGAWTNAVSPGTPLLQLGAVQTPIVALYTAYARRHSGDGISGPKRSWHAPHHLHVLTSLCLPPSPSPRLW